MEHSVPARLTMAHGSALRSLTGPIDDGIDGLTVAARQAGRQRLISGKRANHIERLDTAFAVNRHLSMQKVQAFFRDLGEHIVELVLVALDLRLNLGGRPCKALNRRF